MSRRLPLFPLDLVLFPGALLPLHIFEQRYRRLLADCLEGDRRFGLLLPGPEGADPPTGVIGTVAQIRATQTLPDGRSNIVVGGEGRFRLRGYVEPESPYLVGLVDDFADEESVDPAAAERVPELRRLGDRCLDALNALTDGEPTPDWSTDPGELSFQLAALLRLDLDFKRRLLGIRSAAERTGLLLEIAPPAVRDLEARAVVKVRAKRNGTGGAHPDLEIPGA